MKWLKLIGLGIAIWGLSLVWPEVNQVLTPRAMLAVAFGLGVVYLIYVLLKQNPNHSPWDRLRRELHHIRVHIEMPHAPGTDNHVTKPIRPV